MVKHLRREVLGNVDDSISRGTIVPDSCCSSCVSRSVLPLLMAPSIICVVYLGFCLISPDSECVGHVVGGEVAASMTIDHGTFFAEGAAI